MQKAEFYMEYGNQKNLTALDQYVLYNKFPWKIVLYTLLIIFTTYQVLCMIGQQTATNRAQHAILKKLILNQDEDFDTYYYYGLEEFQQQMIDMQSNLSQINDIVIPRIDSSETKYTLNAFYNKFNFDNINKTTWDIDIDEPIINPFDLKDIKSIKRFTNQIAELEFKGQNMYYFVQYPDLKNSPTCYVWSFSVKYKFINLGSIEVILDTQDDQCSGDRETSAGQSFAFVHAIVFVLGCTSLLISIRQIFKASVLYLYHKEIYSNVVTYLEKSKGPIDNSKPDVSGIFNQKKDDQEQDFEFFNFWFIICGLGGLFSTIGAAIALLDIIIDTDLSIFRLQGNMMGLGCFFSWMVPIKYLEYFENINMMSSTLRRSSRNILMFLISILPFFFGFAFLAQCIFYKFYYFKNTVESAISLFALANGDIMLETFDTTRSRGILGQIFITIFMVLFFTAVQSVLVTIIMEGYEKNRSEIKEKQKKNDSMIQEIQSGYQKFIRDNQAGTMTYLRSLDLFINELRKLADQIDDADIEKY
ncbi:hypothetical protein pb186bvf_000512 [Paramecium bursaria]